ncbi:fasciclin domain-containing protein [Sphingobacterium sp. T2]|uniref:fasciclin domain-containing protein n=1 Tax=Sphingobacterium sp. T2 TaxID=1590596 RepID=UPI00057BACFD|nr:fasciclin domain-containing protein [Sphingobacterium sp. T2]
MKRLFNIKLLFLAFMSIGIAMSSCKQDYYMDGGVHNPNYDGTILQFLKSRPELFDTLVKIIDMSEYASLLNDPNAKITFFAPTNQSIVKSMGVLNRQLYSNGHDTLLDVRQVSPAVWNKYLARYIFNDKYLLKDFPQIDTNNMLAYPGQGYLSIKGDPINIGTFYNDVITRNNAGVEQIVKYAGYRQIVVAYSNPVATSDIQPVNGAVHVLQFQKHSFGFSSFDFATDAINYGFTY